MNLKVLFVCSGNSKEGINVIIKNQGDSLVDSGLQVDYFTIAGEGIRSYIRHIFILRQYLKNNKYDIVHAHYSFSAITATLSGCKQLIVSLMGSDVYSGAIWRLLIRFFSFCFWKVTIVKSKRMQEKIRISSCDIIPNGVNIDVFKPKDKDNVRKELKLDRDKKYILFASNPYRTEKNYSLAKESVSLLNNNNVELLVVKGVASSDMPRYINAVDLVLLTSLYEGSANIIKEAMACNRPIVSTDVGDVRYNIENLDGCFITSQNASDISEMIRTALLFQNTNGRERLLSLGLDSKTIAEKLNSIYARIK